MSFDFSRLLALLLALAGTVQGKTVIAAVGDSVTAGDHGLPPFASDDEGNYPFFLQGLLDDAYPGQFEVANLGLSGATASDGTNKPYRNGKYWPQLQELPFDVAIVTLGTNDAKLAFWDSPDFGVDKFEADYGQVLTDIIAMRPNATILVGYPVPYACPLGGPHAVWKSTSECASMAWGARNLISTQASSARECGVATPPSSTRTCSGRRTASPSG